MTKLSCPKQHWWSFLIIFDDDYDITLTFTFIFSDTFTFMFTFTSQKIWIFTFSFPDNTDDHRSSGPLSPRFYSWGNWWIWTTGKIFWSQLWWVGSRSSWLMIRWTIIFKGPYIFCHQVDKFFMATATIRANASLDGLDKCGEVPKDSMHLLRSATPGESDLPW